MIDVLFIQVPSRSYCMTPGNVFWHNAGVNAYVLLWGTLP